MRKILLSIIPIALLILIGVAVAYEPAKTPQSTQATQAPSVNELLALTNAERQRAGVPALVLDDRLIKSAQIRAEDMVNRNYFSHLDPITQRNNALDLYTYYPNCSQGSENITQNTIINDSEHAITAFMNSPLHREAMLDAKYDQVGFGIAHDKIVQHFCDV